MKMHWQNQLPFPVFDEQGPNVYYYSKYVLKLSNAASNLACLCLFVTTIYHTIKDGNIAMHENRTIKSENKNISIA